MAIVAIHSLSLLLVLLLDPLVVQRALILLLAEMVCELLKFAYKLDHLAPSWVVYQHVQRILRLGSFLSVLAEGLCFHSHNLEPLAGQQNGTLLAVR